MIESNTILQTDMSNQKIIALTFDDGPSEITPQLLELLDKYEIKATFFMLGKKAKQYPEIVYQVFEKGHLVANHTYSHEKMRKTKTGDYINSLNKTNDVLEEITGIRPDYFRPPHGNISPIKLKQIPMICVNWNLDTIDWKYQDAENLSNRIEKRVKDGSIILMHDKFSSTIEGLENTIITLLDEGYSFATVDEILRRNNNTLKSGVAYRSSSAKHPALKY